ncbi:hypothetical protein ACRAWF_43805 [Streptomyces sp. L7]
MLGKQYPIILTDSGTGLLYSAMRGVAGPRRPAVIISAPVRGRCEQREYDAGLAVRARVRGSRPRSLTVISGVRETGKTDQGGGHRQPLRDALPGCRGRAVRRASGRRCGGRPRHDAAEGPGVVLQPRGPGRRGLRPPPADARPVDERRQPPPVLAPPMPGQQGYPGAQGYPGQQGYPAQQQPYPGQPGAYPRSSRNRSRASSSCTASSPTLLSRDKASSPRRPTPSIRDSRPSPTRSTRAMPSRRRAPRPRRPHPRSSNPTAEHEGRPVPTSTGRPSAS